MRIHLIAGGSRMPGWVTSAYREYARRLPHECRLELVEVPLSKKRRGGDLSKAMADEDARMQKAIPERATTIAMEVGGKAWSTERLAQDLKFWMGEGRNLALLIGGPDGLGPRCLAAAEGRRSLSQLTLPHALVRVILAEQLFRAHSILAGHPYHRA